MPTLNIVVPPETTALLNHLAAYDQQALAGAAAADVSPTMTSELVQASGDVSGFGPSGFSRSWIAEPNGAGLSVVNDAPLARFIEFPTPPHPIFARPGGVLAWVPGRLAFSAFNASNAKASSGWAYAKSVRHPGTPGKYVFENYINGDGNDLVALAMIQKIDEYLAGQSAIA